MRPPPANCTMATIRGLPFRSRLVSKATGTPRRTPNASYGADASDVIVRPSSWNTTLPSPAIGSPASPRNTYRMPLSVEPASGSGDVRVGDADTASACVVVSATVNSESVVTVEPSRSRATAEMWCAPIDSRFDSNGNALATHERHTRAVGVPAKSNGLDVSLENATPSMEKETRRTPTRSVVAPMYALTPPRSTAPESGLGDVRVALVEYDSVSRADAEMVIDTVAAVDCRC